MAWEAAALGGSAAGSAGSVALAVARLQDPVMKVLYQEVDELEARLALHGERQVRECRVAVRCEADILKASHEAHMTEAQDELKSLQRQVAERELSLKRNSRRLLDMQLRIRKKYHIPSKQERLAAEQEHEMACAAIVQSEVAVQEQHGAECAILKRELDQHNMVHLSCFDPIFREKLKWSAGRCHKVDGFACFASQVGS